MAEGEMGLRGSKRAPVIVDMRQLEADVERFYILPDWEIKKLAEEKGMIEPFVPRQEGKPSYGLSSFGYDIRLGKRFLVPLGGANTVLDPLNFPTDHFREVIAEDYFDIAPHSQVLAESVEWFRMPDDVGAWCYGKSSYARCGLLVNFTMAEPAWQGRLTLELANLSPLPIRLYVGRGIAQIVFIRGPRPARTYVEKESGGAYQDQPGATLPR